MVVVVRCGGSGGTSDGGDVKVIVLVMVAAVTVR